MQSCGGARPGGLVATEFQEWLRCRALPAIKDFARANFRERRPPEWFSWSAYKRLCAGFDRAPSAMEPQFLLALDADARHTMNDMWPAIDARMQIGTPLTQNEPPMQRQDRRLIPTGHPGHIPLHPVYNYTPSAPRVPDAVQFPIESVFSSVKRRFRARMRDLAAARGGGGVVRSGDMFAAVEASFQEGATALSIHNRFMHAERNMRVFSGEEGSVVTIDGVTYHCTGGNWLPAVLRA